VSLTGELALRQVFSRFWIALPCIDQGDDWVVDLIVKLQFILLDGLVTELVLILL